MERLRKSRIVMVAVAVLVATAGPRIAKAQDADDQQRGVARISLMNGEVSVKRGDAGQWVAGVINAPLLTGDQISTAPNSRAEVQFDASNLMRLGGTAEAHLAQVEYGRYQIELAHGTLTYVVIRPSSASVEVDTPSVSVRPSNQGIYRITVNDAGETEVIARSGDVEVFTPRGSQWVSAGQMMLARGTQADPEFQIVAARPLDDWDRWNQSRDQVLTRSTSYQHVPPGVYGAEDLDSYGSWVDVASYGSVWRPTVDPGWAPYRTGRWVWEDWYGWTWVSYDPWGWAPYHYGRWFYDGGFGWCWYPGVLGVRHFWSPALVAWFGFGPHAGLGFGFGHVGWVPLAPFETFRPWWGRGFYGRGFNERINITNVNITNVYRNARIGNGISGVSATDFQGGRFHNIAGFSGNQVREAGLVRGQVPLAPNNSHLNFANRSAGFVPRSAGNTRFFTHQQVSTPQRIPFAQQQRTLSGTAGTAGRSFGSPAAGSVQRGGFGATGQQSAPVARGQAAPNAGAGGGNWRQFNGTSGQPSATRQGNGGGSGGAWNGARPSPSLQNTRPSAGANSLSTPPDRGGWRQSSGPSGQSAAPRQAPAAPSRSPAPQSRGGWSQFGSPGGASRQQPSPAQSAPRSNFQRGSGFGSPRYSAPAAPSAGRSYSAPAPSRGSGGGGGGRPSGGGGGHSSGGGGGHSSGGGHGRH
jgi:FecR protein